MVAGPVDEGGCLLRGPLLPRRVVRFPEAPQLCQAATEGRRPRVSGEEFLTKLAEELVATHHASAPSDVLGHRLGLLELIHARPVLTPCRAQSLLGLSPLRLLCILLGLEPRLALGFFFRAL